jgi:hypothetical protein
MHPISAPACTESSRYRQETRSYLAVGPLRNAKTAAHFLEGSGAHAKLLRNCMQGQVEVLTQSLARHCR